jgi:hypothetical protein
VVTPEYDPVYTRPLPGGGYVKIEVAPRVAASSAVEGEMGASARLLVERRADPGRRVGHVPPVVAESIAPTLQRALDELYDIAADNVEVARAIQRWQSVHGAP